MGKIEKGVGSPHQRLAKAIGSSENKNVVGGTISRNNGKYVVTENSGHFGENWTPEIREKFTEFMKSHAGVDVKNTGYVPNH